MDEPSRRRVRSDRGHTASEASCYYRLFAAGICGMGITDREHRWIHVNDQLCEMLGVTPEDLLGSRRTDLVHPDDQTVEHVQLSQIVDAKVDGYRIETRLLRADREALPVQLSVQCDRGDDGTPCRYYVLVEDISSRKEAEQNRRREREQYRTLVEFISAVFWEADSETGRLTFVSNKADALFGYPARRFIDEPDFWLGCVHPSDRETAAQYRAQAISERQAQTCDYRILAHSGAVKWVRDTATPVIRRGVLAKLVGVMMEITAMKETERALEYVSGLQHVLVEVSQRFISSRADEVDDLIHEALGRVGSYCGADRAYVFQVNEDLTLMDNTHEWCAPGIPSDRARYRDVSADVAPGFVGRMAQGEPFHIPQVSDLPKGWVRNTLYHGSGIQSLVLVPILVDDRLYGFIGFDSVREERSWSSEEIRMLQGLADTIAATIRRSKAEAHVQFLASYDPLTRLPNRQLLAEILEQAVSAGIRDGSLGALFFMDLDNFKTINDTLGHDIGDRLLQQIAARLHASVRESDTVARFGADEFVVAVTTLGGDTAQAVSRSKAIGEKLLTDLSAPYQLDEQTHHCTASIGVTLFGYHFESPDEIIQRADLAMAQAKEEGRATVRIFEPSMREAAVSRLRLENALRSALSKGEIVPHFQPLVDSEGRIVGAEALARWHHPELGMVPPARFVPTAEQSGLIRTLGRHVLAGVCTELAEWNDHRVTANLAVSVNVSAYEFHHPSFVDDVLGVIEESGVDPCRIQFEPTESVLFADMEDTSTKMNALRERGINFWLDDFGTGYSSLAYLRSLPLDGLKIDQQFVRDAPTDPNDSAIVRAIIGMSRTLGMDVIAEGVETEEVRRLLEQYGCRTYQGFLFAAPLPAEEFRSFVRTHADGHPAGSGRG